MICGTDWLFVRLGTGLDLEIEASAGGAGGGGVDVVVVVVRRFAASKVLSSESDPKDEDVPVFP